MNRSSTSGELTLDTLVRSLTRADKVLLAVVVVCLAIGFLLPAGFLGFTLRIAGYGTGFALAIRLVRRFLRKIIWSLRNRLLVAYGFIAFVPILLLITLAFLALYACVGQMAVYMVNAELERRTALLISLTEHLADSGGGEAAQVEQALPVLAPRMPGLEIRVDGARPWKFPTTSDIETPHGDWGDAGGIVVKDGLLYSWAHIVRPSARVTAMVPLTSRFLAGLAPNIGEISFLRLDQLSGDTTRRKLRLHRYTGEAFESNGPRNRVPEPEWTWDIEVRWATAIPAFLWESPGRVENELIRVRTRPHAVLNTIFAQKVDVFQDIVPAATLALLIAFLIAEVSSFVVGISVSRTITGAVNDLYEATERIREGDFSHRIAVKGRDQLASLSLSFNKMTADLERLLVVAKERERLQAELEIAREVQAQLYPRAVPESPTLRLTAHCNPARMVSGDYYDYQRLDQTRLALAIGDVSGKGISAALLMATVQSALRTQIRHCLEALHHADPQSQLSTSVLVSHLNRHLHAHTSPEKFATFCFGIYHETSCVFTYTNAGHLPPILLRGGEPHMLDVNGTVVGAFPFSRYQESQIELLPGDLLLLYTDGITEAENSYGEQFGEDRLLEQLRRNRERKPDEILKAVLEAVREWTGAGELQDDMTMLLAERI
ncbi:MAG: SpoIIE family protein phosphatase [Bryobacterales bacterium]|nr:SpoIIE family protein phosphatase [Bryobacterales bacterium]